MAEMNGSLLPQHAALDPQSLLLSQFSDSGKPQLLQLTTESFVMERGPRFKEYSDLRERKLRMKNSMDPPEEKILHRSLLTPPKKQVKFSSTFSTPPKRLKAPSALAQSVPDFSSTLRKENRKPPALPPVAERSLTPPAGFLKSGSVYGKLGGGSKSVNSAEKRNGGLMARKSYASMAELKGLAATAGNAINGGGRSTRGVARTVLGSRHF
ncbi:uncharacterized protein LOC131023852 [Salvia miltiorrhiza]|uniref:uncharacterized protein LOC131023538 n=1 Tax=Salvia miltiorrhiza TaxID=226208 RepID=UPI0025AD6B5E|nr:uncharacterized protein LOC131023538 [Salvia miltiorrhiza]XP_057809451.1 uncharacterized protein LOC131023852 [Salvia miltiorrhiza]